MARPNIKKIRGAAHPLGTGDFTTIQAWEDWADGLSDPYQWAECFQGVDLGTFTLSGWSSTPTSSGYPKIFASSGELHDGSLSKGPIIAPIGSTALNTIGVNYARVDGLGSTRGFEMNINTAANMIIENCWSTSEDSSCFKARSSVGTTTSSGNIFRNCLAIGTEGNDTGFEIGGDNMMGGKPGIKCLNNTAYGHKNVGIKVFNTKLPGFNGGADVDVKNCISMDCGSDFAYIDTGGNGTIDNENNLSSDTTSTTYGIYNLTLESASGVFINPDKRISVTTLGIAGSGVVVSPSGNFKLKRTSPAVDRGLVLAEVIKDFRGLKRGYDVLGFGAPDIGAYEYGFLNTSPISGVPLFIAGPVYSSSGIPLIVGADTTRTVASGTLFIDGTSITSSNINLFTTAKIPSSGQSLLNIGNFTFKRTSPLFIKTESIEEAEGVGGLGSLFGGLDIAGGGGGGGGSAQQLSIAKPSSVINLGTLFLQADKQTASGLVPLNVQGFSGVVGPESLAYYRNPDLNSDGYFPKRRTAFLFAASERNCIDGSLYKFDSNINDNSSDYQLKLYASGWGSDVHTNTYKNSHEGELYRTSTRFPSTSLTGSGTARIAAGLGSEGTTTHWGTIITQSGSPSIHDQHRFTPPSGHVDASGNFTSPRRGVAVSFWINKKNGLNTTPVFKTPQGLMGNLMLGGVSGPLAASGEWGLYHVPTKVSASGNTPFNSLKNTFFKKGVDGRFRTSFNDFGGLVAFTNTTAGGSMGRLLRKDNDENVVLEHLPDLMIPMEEDRWYYMQFWWDIELKSSFARIAAPAKGTPGQSGYYSEIKPITDRCQKWTGYEIKTEADNLKFKIGGGLNREETAPYHNLGYQGVGNPREEFIIDELVVSNKVCSVTAMNQQFDEKYEFFTKQFYAPQSASLYITGEEDAVSAIVRLFGDE